MGGEASIWRSRTVIDFDRDTKKLIFNEIHTKKCTAKVQDFDLYGTFMCVSNSIIDREAESDQTVLLFLPFSQRCIIKVLN